MNFCVYREESQRDRVGNEEEGREGEGVDLRTHPCLQTKEGKCGIQWVRSSSWHHELKKSLYQPAQIWALWEEKAGVRGSPTTEGALNSSALAIGAMGDGGVWTGHGSHASPVLSCLLGQHASPPPQLPYKGDQI